MAASETHALNITNLRFLILRLDLMILMGTNSLQRSLEGVGPKIETFLGPERATSETHAHKSTNVPNFFYMGAWT
jgi:hypothetical protein